MEYDHHTDGLVVLPLSLVYLNSIVLVVYAHSPAAYRALESFGILKLPSKSTMQAYTGAFMHEPGASSVCIADQVARYVTFVEESHKAGRQEPKADGVLIFDEVKVACQLLWNSQSHKLKGLAMTSGDLSSLTEPGDPVTNLQTSYVLQFLWRAVMILLSHILYPLHLWRTSL